MKHLQTINEWFGHKKDSEIIIFIENIIKITKEENIKIDKTQLYSPLDDEQYDVNIDGILYKFSHYTHFRKSSISFDDTSVEIPKKYFSQIAKLYYQQEAEKNKIREIERKKEKEEIINNLPDLSEVGRAAKKYNL